MQICWLEGCFNSYSESAYILLCKSSIATNRYGSIDYSICAPMQLPKAAICLPPFTLTAAICAMCGRKSHHPEIFILPHVPREPLCNMRVSACTTQTKKRCKLENYLFEIACGTKKNRQLVMGPKCFVRFCEDFEAWSKRYALAHHRARNGKAQVYRMKAGQWRLMLKL